MAYIWHQPVVLEHKERVPARSSSSRMGAGGPLRAEAGQSRTTGRAGRAPAPVVAALDLLGYDVLAVSDVCVQQVRVHVARGVAGRLLGHQLAIRVAHGPVEVADHVASLAVAPHGPRRLRDARALVEHLLRRHLGVQRQRREEHALVVRARRQVRPVLLVESGESSTFGRAEAGC